MKSWKTAFWLLVLVVAVVHAPGLGNEFYWDDRPQVVNGQLIRSWSSVPKIFGSEVWHNVDLGKRAPEAKLDTYRPLFNLSLLLDYQLWGLNAFGYHLTNILIHLLVILFFYFAVSHLFSPAAAFWATLFFAVHPLTVESAQYVSARADSLAALFLTAALWLGLRKNPPSWKNILLMMIAFLCGTMSKEAALLFPIVWAAMLGNEVIDKHKWKAFGLLVMTLIVYFIIRSKALGHLKTLTDVTHIWEIVVNYPRYFARFISMVVWPVNNMPMQNFIVLRPPFHWLPTVGAVLFYAVGTVIVLWQFRKRAMVALGIVWMLVTLAPSTFAVTMTETMDPHHNYVPLLGMAILVGAFVEWCGRKEWSWKRYMIPLGSVCLLLFTYSAYTIQFYRTEIGFYQKILSFHPDYVIPRYNLANTFARQQLWSKAIPEYLSVLKQDPTHVSAAHNLGVAYLNVKKYKKARRILERVAKANPEVARYHYNFALALAHLGRTKEANGELRKAFEIDPEYVKKQRGIK